MTKQVDLVSEIIIELKRVEGLAEPPIDKDDVLQIPRMIPTGGGNGLIVSRKIDDLISRLARELQKSDPTLSKSFTGEEWGTMVRKAFGPALLPIDLEDDPTESGRIVLAEVKRIVAKQAGSNGPREYAFGCTLFGNVDIDGFRIGPVRFEPRLSWLERKVLEGDVSRITRRRVVRAWQDKKPGKRKPSYDSISEGGILGAIGSCPYVCSVNAAGFAAKAGEEKALTVARLALTAIALLWETPSKALSGFNLFFDRSVHRRKTLTFVPGTIALSGSSLSHMPHGPRVTPEGWKNQLAKKAAHFEVVGSILEYFLSTDGAVARPRMMNTLGQALLWFHEACREPVTLMSIVKFSASLDALAGGGRASGIRRLIKARLGIKDEDAALKDGTTLKQVIDEIYSDGRSRTIHGTNDKLGYDWSVTKSVAEHLARYCLVTCIYWVGKHPSVDDPSQLST